MLGAGASRHHPLRMMARPPVRRRTMEDPIRSRQGMMAAYDLLAPHYDAVTGDPATEAAFIHDLIAERHQQAVTVLDLACGTGSITALLAGAYQVSGMDISPGMLAVAREKLPSRTPLHLADMTSFRLGASFDVI